MVVFKMVTRIPETLIGIECEGNKTRSPGFVDQIWPLLESHAADLKIYEFDARKRLFRAPASRSIRSLGLLAGCDRKARTHVRMSSWYGGHLNILYETKDINLPVLLVSQWPHVQVTSEIDFGLSLEDANTLMEFVISRPTESFCFSFFHDGAPLIAFASAAGPFEAMSRRLMHSDKNMRSRLG